MVTENARHFAVHRILTRLLGLALASFWATGFAFAQKPPLTSFLPRTTWLYVHWHGTSSLSGVRSTNSMLRFLNDPSVEAWRKNVLDQIVQRQEKKHPQSNIQVRSDINIADSLLENEAVFGLASGAGGDAVASSVPMSGFLILDDTGKQDLLAKLRDELTKNSTPAPVRTPITIAGHPAFQISSGKNTSYEAQTDNYYVHTDNLALMGELLSRLTAPPGAANPHTPLEGAPLACGNFPKGALVDYLALPEKLAITKSAPNPNFDFGTFIKSLHLDQIHAACGSLKFEATATRMKAIVLGDTSPGSVLNFWANGRDSFATMALAPAGSAFGGSILDFAALYTSLRAALLAALPPQRSSFVGGMEVMLTSAWGMSPEAAMGLFTGEMSAISVNPSVDPSQKIYAATIQQPDRLLALLEKIFANSHPAEMHEGTTTYLTLTFPVDAGGAVTPNVFVVAVTPTMLIAGKDQDLVRQSVARLEQSKIPGTAAGLASDAQYQRLRAMFPRELNGFSYTDLAHYNWKKSVADAEKSLQEQQHAAASHGGQTQPPFDFFQGFDPLAVARYLHYAVSGSWKDSNGLYFESTVQ